MKGGRKKSGGVVDAKAFLKVFVDLTNKGNETTLGFRMAPDDLSVMLRVAEAYCFV